MLKPPVTVNPQYQQLPEPHLSTARTRAREHRRERDPKQETTDVCLPRHTANGSAMNADALQSGVKLHGEPQQEI